MLFVDHDQARLAGREDERWNFDGGGGVTVLAGPAPQAAPQAERVTIRLETTSAADVIGQVRAIDGVRVISVDVEGRIGRGRQIVTALLRYQTAILLRSHRWIFPLIAYGLLIAVGAAGLDVTRGDARLERRDARPGRRVPDQGHAHRRAGRRPRLRLPPRPARSARSWPP